MSRNETAPRTAKASSGQLSVALWVFVYAVLTAALVVRVRWGATPDEAAHVSYVEFVAARNELPVFNPIAQQDNPGGYEFHQPPLYYAVSALGWKALPAGVQNYWCRFVSLICGALTVWLVGLACRRVLSPHVAILATAFCALWPMHQAVGASSGNDAMAGLVCAALFLTMTRWIDRAPTMRDAMLVGALIGVGILTKTTCLIVGVVAIGALAHFAMRNLNDQVNQSTDEAPQSTLRPVPAVATALAVSALIGGWWLWRNQSLYGDPFAQNAFNRAFGFDIRTGKGSPGPAELMMLGSSFGTIMRGLLLSVFWTCWGFWGGPESAQMVINGYRNQIDWVRFMPATPLIAACALASLFTLIGAIKAFMSRGSQEGDESAPMVQRWWAIGLLLVSLAWVSFAARYLAAGQARYFHAALLPLCVFGALYWAHFWGSAVVNTRRLTIASALFGGVLLTISGWNILAWRTLV
ncbi:MAG: hypothetical protein JWN98_849 [Abditibacteriota bacterium]|nr:hypothetical protein [Abditibacteriota bacterium]